MLDTKSGEIVLPLTAYDFFDSWTNQALVNRAISISIGACMQAEGFAFSSAGVEDSPESNVGDRSYGLWDEDRVRLYGYGAAPSAAAAALTADQSAGGQGWEKAYQSCTASLNPDVAGFIPTNEEQTESIVPRLKTDAYNSASADPAWQKAREKWWGCLRDQGLTPRTGSGDWSSQQGADILAAYGADGSSPDKENEIRVAFTEAQCNVKTRLAQTLGDLEASYQQPLIEANEAALSELKSQNQKRLAAAREYIANHG